MKRLREAQPQQGQNPPPPKPPGPPDFTEVMGKVITVTDPGGRSHRARVLGYLGAENGFELEMEGEYPHPQMLTSQLDKQGWHVPKIGTMGIRQRELGRLGNLVRREATPPPTVESAQRIVDRLLD